MTSIANRHNPLFIFEKIEKFLILILPIALITGPAIPDIIITLLSIFFLFKKKFYNKIYKYKEVGVLFIFFISLFLTYLVEFDLIYLINTFIFLRFIFFILNVTEIFTKDKKLFDYFILIFLVIYFFQILNVIFQYIHNYDFFGFPKIYFEDLELYRLSGTFNDELVVGSYFSKTLPIIILGIIFHCRINHLFSLFICLGIIIVIYLTGERAAFLSSIMFFLLLGFVLYRYKFLFSLIFFSPFIILIINNLDLILINNIYNYLLNFISSSYFALFKSSILVANESIILGSGHRSFERLCHSFIEFDINVDFDKCSTHPHNYYLEILTSYGLKSVFVFLIFYIYLLTNFFKTNVHIKSKILISGLLVIFFPIMTSSSLFNNNWNMGVISVVILVCQYLIHEDKKQI